jgi:hypothetical protein
MGIDRPSPMVARIVMTESGGIAGIVNVLTVENNFAVAYQTRQGTRTGRLSAEEMGDLVAIFYDNGFFSLQNDYRPKTIIADGITTSIAYADSKRAKTVITGSGASDPQALQTIVRALKGVIGQTK